MSAHKTFIRNFICWILIVFALALFALVPTSHAAGRLLAWPSDNGLMQSQSAVTLKPHEVRKGQITLSPEILPKPTGTGNIQAEITASKDETDTVSIGLFPDVAYEVLVNSVKHYADGTMIISGKLKDHTIGTVVMTVGPEGFFITVQDMKRALLYRVTGNSRQGSGSVTEIDTTKMPPMIR